LRSESITGRDARLWTDIKQCPSINGLFYILISSILTLFCQCDLCAVWFSQWQFNIPAATAKIALIAAVHEFVAMGDRHATPALRRRDLERDMRKWLVTECRAHGVNLPETGLVDLLTPDVSLNNEYWLDHRASEPAG
jgi:hypothetical protein